MPPPKENPHGKSQGARDYQHRNHNNLCLSPQPDFRVINADALSVLPALLARWLPGGIVRGREYVVRNPMRADNNPGSFKINLRTGRWADFATGDKGGDVVSLAAYLSGRKQGDAARELARMLGVRHG